MSFEYFIGRRFLRTKQKQAFISLITILSTAGVTVGVMALIVVIAVMSGFDADLKARILGGQSHLVVKRHGGVMPDYQQAIEIIEKMDGVVAASPVIYSQVMLRSSNQVSGAVLRGIDPESAGKVIKTLEKIILPAHIESDNNKSVSRSIPGIVLGKELAGNLSVEVGDIIYLISPRGMLSPVGHMPSMKQFKVTGYFESGMYDFDGTFAFIHLKEAQKIMRLKDEVSGIEVRIKNIYKAGEIGQKIKSELGFPYWTLDWMRRNQNLFAALKLEKLVMFIILTLIVLVAAFNIASTLIMMVMGKTKDIAILKAMGATDKSIMKIFVFKGMVIGSVGTTLGFFFGLIICTVLEHFKIAELTGEIYYFTTKLPVQMEFSDVFLIVTSALVICFLATLYPARQAAKLDPIEAIRYG